jgi:hypothetical protein
MSPDIKESDWKIFKQIHRIAMDRYFERAASEIRFLMTDQSKSNQERFWLVADAIKRGQKEAARLFDDSRRSTALIQLAMIHSKKLLADDEMSRFSPDARERVRCYLGIVAT